MTDAEILAALKAVQQAFREYSAKLDERGRRLELLQASGGRHD